MVLRSLKGLLILPALLLISLSAYAQKVVFDVTAPTIVASEEIFRLEFFANASPDDFKAPDFPGFEIIAGPSTSHSQNVSIVGGNMVSEFRFSIIYVLRPTQAGKHVIQSAQAVVDGKTYSTKALAIEVVSEGGQAQGAAGGQGQAQQQQPQEQQGQQQTGNAAIAPDDLMIRAVVDRTSVFKGQPVRVAFKIYNRNVNLAGHEGVRMPAFNGFWAQEVNVNSQWKRETYNDRVYETLVLKEYLLYPQQAGTLSIEQMEMTFLAHIITHSRRQSLLDDFFGGGPDVQQTKKKVQSAPVRINVRELPAGAPASFNGAVGSFTMTTEYPRTSIPANSSAVYVIKISGMGNLPLIQAPKIDMPGSFEQYNIKTTESFQPTGNGISGYRQFEYPFIARAEGTYTLPPVTFSFFDPAQARYITLDTDNVMLDITPDSAGRSGVSGGLVSGLTKEDIKILDQDIRFIKIGAAGLSAKNSILIGSWQYWLAAALIAALFGLSLIYLRKRIKEMKNSALIRGKRANKVALQRLRAAENHMKQNNRRGFYEEMLKAMWGYMSDKLNIPVANLTKENVREEMTKRNIPVEQTARFIELISESEYAQYSPETSGEMNEIYVSAVEIISKLESQIKR